MADSDRPRSPFAGMADFSARTPVRELSTDEVEQMLASHLLYLNTEYHEGHRANFSSIDLNGRDFSGLNLRGIKMDRALLKGADFTGANLQREFDRLDLAGGALRSSGSLSGASEWSQPRFGQPRERPPRQG